MGYEKIIVPVDFSATAENPNGGGHFIHADLLYLYHELPF